MTPAPTIPAVRGRWKCGRRQRLHIVTSQALMLSRQGPKRYLFRTHARKRVLAEMASARNSIVTLRVDTDCVSIMPP